MKTITHSHNDGVNVVNPLMVDGIKKVFSHVNWPLQKNCAKKLRKEVLGQLRAQGWTDRVPIAPKQKLTLTAINAHVGLCLQTGNMARFYADLLKLQRTYNDRIIASAIYVLPTLPTSKLMGSNIANFERMTSELILFSDIISMPLIVIGFDQRGT